MLELANRHFRKTGYPIYIGDISNGSGGNTDYNGRPRHAGHIGGTEVDIGMTGNTPGVFCGRYTDSCYKRSQMRALIKEIIAMGGTTNMYFNDPVILNEFPAYVSYSSGHDDHIHVSWEE
jgi:hypothetical protein